MKAFLIIPLLLMLSVWAQAEDLCKVELDPYYKAAEEFNGTDATRKAFLKQYHAHREAVYSVCTGEQVRKYEAQYTHLIGKENMSKLESMNQYPSPRKSRDLGEFGTRYPSSMLSREQEKNLKEESKEE